MSAGILWICSLLLQSDPIRSLDAITMVNAARSRAIEAQQRQTQEQVRREFEHKFNRLIDALQKFTEEYNRAPGQVWPVKNAEALSKAFRDLERTTAWRQQARDQGPVLK